MKQVSALLRLDFLRIRNWFSTYTGTKGVVVLGFTLVVALVTGIEFVFSRTFFAFLAPQEEFGRAVANYSVNAALLILFVFSIASTISASASALFRPDFLRFLLTAPVSIGKLYISRTLGTLVGSSGFLILIMMPVTLAYQTSFAVGPDAIPRSILAYLCLSFSSVTIGNLVTVSMVRRFGTLSRKGIAAIFFVVGSGALLLMRFLFPPSFFRLYFATDWPAFQKQLGQLPLASTLLPTNWLATTITEGISEMTLFAVATTIGIVLLGQWWGKKWYLASYRSIHEGRVLAGKSIAPTIGPSRFPLLKPTATSALFVNEVLMVSRRPSEVTYVAFLSGLSIVLLFMMRSVPKLTEVAPELLPTVYALSLVGLSYLSMTLSARLVYPLIAREKRAAWLVFSIPVKREALLFVKMWFAAVLCLPSMIIGLVAGSLMELPFFTTLIFTVFLLIMSLGVALTQLFLGTIAPNFLESENLEANSTSGSGLAAITLSLVFIALSGWTFYQAVLGSLSFTIAMALLVAVTIILALPLFVLGRRKLYRYDL